MGDSFRVGTGLCWCPCVITLFFPFFIIFPIVTHPPFSACMWVCQFVPHFLLFSGHKKVVTLSIFGQAVFGDVLFLKIQSHPSTSPPSPPPLLAKLCPAQGLGHNLARRGGGDGGKLQSWHRTMLMPLCHHPLFHVLSSFPLSPTTHSQHACGCASLCLTFLLFFQTMKSG